MLQSTFSGISKKDFTTVVFRQVMLFYRSDMLDLEHVRELYDAEFPKTAKARTRKRSTTSRRRTARRRLLPRKYCLDDLLTADEAGKVLNISPKTLANLRCAGGGPEFQKLTNRTIRYRYADLQAFIEQNTKQNTSEYGGMGQ
ncbi:AlpA family transcriptional regulator [Pseudovibrio sp. JE062]|uniref:helix-turn-helix transcriptional regulator n=1 Tax=Pseudovibrio sp. JE062 TaxID=439495 RepID=UPI000680254C|nr:helix-turn-helix domain-containing protein [Pseudovibrio sp. JE062]